MDKYRGAIPTSPTDFTGLASDIIKNEHSTSPESERLVEERELHPFFINFQKDTGLGLGEFFIKRYTQVVPGPATTQATLNLVIDPGFFVFVKNIVMDGPVAGQLQVTFSNMENWQKANAVILDAGILNQIIQTYPAPILRDAPNTGVITLTNQGAPAQTLNITITGIMMPKKQAELILTSLETQALWATLGIKI